MASGSEIAKYAQQFLGTPYVWGGNSLTEGVDCSGLVQQVYAKFGVDVPRVTYDQIKVADTMSAAKLNPGDMVFFDTDRDRSGPDHVGIYLGNGKFIHAPKPGEKVKVSSMTGEFYASRFMGGVRAPGIDGYEYTPEQASAVSAAEEPDISAEEMAANYGWSWAFLNSIPELKNLFEQAVSETWEAGKFQAELQNSEWWTENSTARRQAAVLRNTDPATYNAATDAMLAKIRLMAAEMGAIIPESTLMQIAEDSYSGGISDEQIQQSLAGYITFTKEGTLGGQAGIAEAKMRQLAYLNGVQLSKQAVKNFAQQIAMGVSTEEDAMQYVRNMAISMFPVYEEQINAGQTVTEIASPYTSMMAQNLEISPSEITLNDPLITRALNGLDENGSPQGMTMYEFQQAVRADPRWNQTNNARESMITTGAQVLRDMGLV